jgi:hypothetical protein
MSRFFMVFSLLLGGWSAMVSAADAKPTPITLDQAAERVRINTHGQVLSAQTLQRRDGRQQRTAHRIKVLTAEGRVKVLEYWQDNGSLIAKPKD